MPLSLSIPVELYFPVEHNPSAGGEAPAEPHERFGAGPKSGSGRRRAAAPARHHQPAEHDRGATGQGRLVLWLVVIHDPLLNLVSGEWMALCPISL